MLVIWKKIPDYAKCIAAAKINKFTGEIFDAKNSNK